MVFEVLGSYLLGSLAVRRSVCVELLECLLQAALLLDIFQGKLADARRGRPDALEQLVHLDWLLRSRLRALLQRPRDVLRDSLVLARCRSSRLLCLACLVLPVGRVRSHSARVQDEGEVLLRCVLHLLTGDFLPGGLLLLVLALSRGRMESELA